MSGNGDRDDLLRQLQEGAPQPERSGELVLLSEEDVRLMEPTMVPVYKARRAALFRQFLELQQNQHELVGVKACLHRLLNNLFGDGVADIAHCWQAIYTIHGREYIRPFNEAVNTILRSACAELRTP